MLRRITIIGIIYVFLSLVSIGNGHKYIVNTTIGLVRGYPATDGDYINYLGIPYGQVDENNPFGVATPQPPFEGIFEANNDSDICPQEEEFNHTIVGTLDCLHLKIHVPSSAGPNNLLPVFIWIYGGAFKLGFYGRFIYGPKFLIRHDVVVISLNYRLGPYGFMSLDTPEIPGNQGLKDQVLALRWIRDNIAAFGGDPDKITIAGNSSGSMCVDLLILRENLGPPLIKFHQTILQSGTTYQVSPRTANRQTPLLMAKYLGFETTNNKEAIMFLVQQDPLDVIASSLSLNLSFGVVIEKKFRDVEPFITENWFNLNKIPNAKGLTVMMGFNNDEGLLIASIQSLPALSFIRHFMNDFFDASHPDFESMIEIVQNFYLGAGQKDHLDKPLLDLIGDLKFIYPTFRNLKRLVMNNVKSLYLYEFSYSGERNFVKHRENLTHIGACHADEIGYLFDISYLGKPDSEDQAVLDSMTALWTNFVKYGDPTPQTSRLLPYKWEPITPHSPYYYMNIDLQLSVGTNPLHERMTFWDLLYDGFGHLELFAMSP